jgi:kynurenine formamidase
MGGEEERRALHPSSSFSTSSRLYSSDDREAGKCCSATSAALTILSGALLIAVVLLMGQLTEVHTRLENASELWQTYDNALRRAKYVDLTHAVSPKTPLWPGFSRVVVSSGRAGRAIEGFASKGDVFSVAEHGFRTTQYTFPTDQIGTQLDPPAHWSDQGATISDVPATVSVRPLVVVDVRDKVASEPAYQVTVDDLLAWETKHGVLLPEGSVVAFRTGWGTPDRWANYEASGAVPAAIPGIRLDALQFLHRQRHILFHCHEPLATDSTPSRKGEAWLLRNGFMQAEGIANLHLVKEKGCLVSIGFAKLLGGTGGLARLVAICPPDWPHGKTVIDEPGAPLPEHKYPLRRGSDGVLRPNVDAVAVELCAEGKVAAPVTFAPVLILHFFFWFTSPSRPPSATLPSMLSPSQMYCGFLFQALGPKSCPRAGRMR